MPTIFQIEKLRREIDESTQKRLALLNVANDQTRALPERQTAQANLDTLDDRIQVLRMKLQPV